MTTPDQLRPRSGASHSPPGAPKLGGDELFVPASHMLVIDRQVSHPAFRLWCVLHRLWFLREPPTMPLLQELMGSSVTNKATQQRIWQPATRRSIERWLKELEQAGWLLWTRREETARRYHLRTSARSAPDTAILTELRSLLNSGKATLADVQALLRVVPSIPDDTTPGSNDATAELQQPLGDTTTRSDDATPESHDPILVSQDATLDSHEQTSADNHATPESHDSIVTSHDATPESHDTTLGSHEATAESHYATPPSHSSLTEGVLMRRKQPPYNEILQNEIQEDPTPPSAATGGDGGGLTATERFLLREGFSTRAAHEFRDLDRQVVQADLERRRSLGQGIGAIVSTWRVQRPEAVAARHNTLPAVAHRAISAKAQALALAPPDASPLEIQYLALDLEEGAPHEVACANLLARRGSVLAGGVA